MDTNSSKLRELASWYREFAERAGNPVIWKARFRTAQDLETEADHIDRGLCALNGPQTGGGLARQELGGSEGT